MTARAWSYQPSPAVAQSPAEQFTVFPRPRDMTCSLLRLIWGIWLRIWLRVYCRFTITGRAQLPSSGSFILISNHSSHLDAMILSSALPLKAIDRTFAAAASDYFFSSFWRSMLSATFINALPFDRLKHKRESLDICVDLLEEGDRTLIIFPEGTRSTTGEIQPFKHGIGILAAGKRYPVVPAYIDGAFRAWPRSSILPLPRRVKLIIGKPIAFDQVPRTKEGFAEAAETLERAVRELKPQRGA